MTNILYTFIAAVTAPEKGIEKGIPYPDITIPHSLKTLYAIVKAHPGYVAAFLLVAAIGILVGIIFAIAKGREKRLRRLTLFKPVARLLPTDLRIENYQDCYVKRESDEALASFLEEGVPAILIIGRPGSGKTRTVFEALKGKGDYFLIAPRPRPTSLRELAVPGLSKKKIILFLDDIHRYIANVANVGHIVHLVGHGHLWNKQ